MYVDGVTYIYIYIYTAVPLSVSQLCFCVVDNFFTPFLHFSISKGINTIVTILDYTIFRGVQKVVLEVVRLFKRLSVICDREGFCRNSSWWFWR